MTNFVPSEQRFRGHPLLWIASGFMPTVLLGVVLLIEWEIPAVGPAALLHPLACVAWALALTHFRSDARQWAAGNLKSARIASVASVAVWSVLALAMNALPSAAVVWDALIRARAFYEL